MKFGNKDVGRISWRSQLGSDELSFLLFSCLPNIEKFKHPVGRYILNFSTFVVC